MSLANEISVTSQPEGTGDETWVFSYYDKIGDKAEYRGDLHQVGIRQHKADFYRTQPKRSGNFLGQRKSALKLTLDQEVAGADGVNSYRPNIIQISTSMAIGVTEAEFRLMVYQAAAMITETYFQDLAMKMELS